MFSCPGENAKGLLSTWNVDSVPGSGSRAVSGSFTAVDALLGETSDNGDTGVLKGSDVVDVMVSALLIVRCRCCVFTCRLGGASLPLSIVYKYYV